MPLLEITDAGLYCAAGNFHIDPWRPVPRAIVTHAHADRVHAGMGAYLCTQESESLLRAQTGSDAAIQLVSYGERLQLDRAAVSLHPAGHILGSAQVRIEADGEVWVASGDYGLASDPTCAPFEPIACHTFVTEATFGLPIFRWSEASVTCDAIQSWWRANQDADRASLLFVHPVGEAQRLLALLDGAMGPIYLHPRVAEITALYRAQGIVLPATRTLAEPGPHPRSLIIAPPSVHGTAWEKKFGDVSTAWASGWMRIRGPRRRRSLDRGFAFSNHADWPDVLHAINQTRAENVWVTHGFRSALARWLGEHGRSASVVDANFDEGDE